jgi:hypothetical protein
MDKEEPIRQFYIPSNYSGGVNIGGMNLEIRNIIEAVIIGGILGFVTWYVAGVFTQVFTTRLGITLVPLAMGVVAGLHGYKGEPISSFLKHMADFNKTKRICYYNKRPKFEAKPLDLQQEQVDSEIFLRKQGQELIQKFKSNKASFNEGDTPENLFFEDDVGIVDTPSMYTGYEEELKKKRKEKKANGKKKKRKKKKA